MHSFFYDCTESIAHDYLFKLRFFLFRGFFAAFLFIALFIGIFVLIQTLHQVLLVLIEQAIKLVFFFDPLSSLLTLLILDLLDNELVFLSLDHFAPFRSLLLQLLLSDKLLFALS